VPTSFAPFDFRQLPVLLRGEPGPVQVWIERWNVQRACFHVAVICVGAGLFGVAVGWWRAPLQAFYAGVKLPLIILLTTLGNALLNGMLAPLLGLNLRLRQVSLAILMSFAIAATILGAFSPLMCFLEWNVPPMSSSPSERAAAHSLILVTQALVIAFAGVAANLRLLQLLRRASDRAATAVKVLLAWLAGNLLLGSQLAWILRPVIGSPALPLQFLRPDAFHGNFYESFLSALKRVLFG
jgi:hypothetical protein